MDTYIDKIREDFDMLKLYEDTAVKILNYMSLNKLKHPANSEEFGSHFKKVSPYKRTLFIDLDDTLTSVSLFRTES